MLPNESDLLFRELTIKSWPIWCFPKTQLYLRGGKNRIECGMTVYAYSNACLKRKHLELCHPVLDINSPAECSQQRLFRAVVIYSHGSLMFCRWPHEYSQSWLAFFFLLLLTCSSPDVAFHVPPWRSACGPGPVALSRDTLAANQDKGKAMNHSGESHGHDRLAIH